MKGMRHNLSTKDRVIRGILAVVLMVNAAAASGLVFSGETFDSAMGAVRGQDSLFQYLTFSSIPVDIVSNFVMSQNEEGEGGGDGKAKGNSAGQDEPQKKSSDGASMADLHRKSSSIMPDSANSIGGAPVTSKCTNLPDGVNEQDVHRALIFVLIIQWCSSFLILSFFMLFFLLPRGAIDDYVQYNKINRF